MKMLKWSAEFILGVFLALLFGCAGAPTIEQGTSKQEVLAKITNKAGLGFESIGTPAVPLGGFGSFFSVDVLCQPNQVSYNVSISGSTDLGENCTVTSGEWQTSAKRVLLGTVKIYTASFNEAYMKDAAAKGKEVTFSGGTGTIVVKLWPELISAVLEKSAPAVLKWTHPEKSVVDALAAKVAPITKQERDDYKKLTWITVGPFNTVDDMIQFDLQARCQDDGQVFYWLVMNSTRFFDEGWAFYKSATDRGGVELPVSRDSAVGDGGTTYERISVQLTHDYLQSHVQNGLDLKIYGERAQKTIQVPGWVIDGFLRQVDAPRRKFL